MPRALSWLARLRGGASPPAQPLPPLDLADPQLLGDPYPLYARLRREAPLHRAASGVWLLSRYADVAAALQEPRLGNAPAPYAVLSARNRGRYVCADVANNTIPFQDGAQHQETRQRLARAWTACMRERPPAIERCIEAQLRRCRGLVQFDLLRDFATPLAVTAIAEVLGLPPSEREAAHADAQWFFYLFASMPSQTVREQVDAALLRLRRLFGAMLDARLAGGEAADLTAYLARELHSGDGYTRELVVDHLMLLWADGIENVDKGIAAAVATLLRHPAQWRALCADPGLAKAAAAECLRFESPAQYIARIVLEDFELHGQMLRRGQAVLLLLGAANRDERQFEHADRFDIHRPPAAALSFGRGAHSCIGATLARSELEQALAALAVQLPQLALASDRLEWQARAAHRWLQCLPVRAGA